MLIVTKCCQQSTHDLRLSITVNVHICTQHNNDWVRRNASHGPLVSTKTCFLLTTIIQCFDKTRVYIVHVGDYSFDHENDCTGVPISVVLVIETVQAFHPGTSDPSLCLQNTYSVCSKASQNEL